MKRVNGPQVQLHPPACGTVTEYLVEFDGHSDYLPTLLRSPLLAA
jgi:hypothetical protein